MSENEDNVPLGCRMAEDREARLAQLKKQEEDLLAPIVARLDDTADPTVLLERIIKIQQRFARKREELEGS